MWARNGDHELCARGCSACAGSVAISPNSYISTPMPCPKQQQHARHRSSTQRCSYSSPSLSVSLPRVELACLTLPALPAGPHAPALGLSCPQSPACSAEPPSMARLRARLRATLRRSSNCGGRFGATLASTPPCTANGGDGGGREAAVGSMPSARARGIVDVTMPNVQARQRKVAVPAVGHVSCATQRNGNPAARCVPLGEPRSKSASGGRSFSNPGKATCGVVKQ